MNTKSTAKLAKEEQFMKSDLVQELNFLIARMRSLGSSRANQALQPFGLKVRSYSVLSLACSDFTPTQREMAEFLALDPSQIVPLVDGLETGGLVTRMPDPNDRRSKVIVATEAGRKLYARARKITKQNENETLEALTPEERLQLRDLLSRVALPGAE
ncbi:MarR family transcriptional regulator [Glutamicibacter sp. JL.03c]|uniref:MarR family winged helix-turn-helix transcriptional regulator n=1 Tax=Glutamicibacter sp. JL.03c TaxID=2984842 RepID=UPI0021F79FE2|nr:MarR family transcriptional regulator [Glutamicibacter sp. JL.03c]UYQ78002.1 MarR family transcriptional regulator [Glutamicibacter sp. JL.03c]